MLQAQSRLAEAEPLYREALPGQRRVLGNRHPDTLATINNMATLLRDQHKLAEAEPLCREALAGRRRALGKCHRDTLNSVSNLASVLLDQGKLAEAEPLYRESLAGRHCLLGDSHQATLAGVDRLANLLKAQGKLWKRSRCTARRWLDTAACWATAIRPRKLASTTWPTFFMIKARWRRLTHCATADR